MIDVRLGGEKLMPVSNPSLLAKFRGLPYANENWVFQHPELKFDLYASVLHFSDFDISLYHIETALAASVDISQPCSRAELIFPFSAVVLQHNGFAPIFADAFMPMARHIPDGQCRYYLRPRQTYDLLVISCSRKMLSAISGEGDGWVPFKKSMEEHGSAQYGPSQCLPMGHKLLLTFIDLFSQQFPISTQRLYLEEAFLLFFLECIRALIPSEAMTDMSPRALTQYAKTFEAVYALSEKPYLYLTRMSEVLATNDYIIQEGLKKYFNTNFLRFKQDIKLKKGIQLLIFSHEGIQEISGQIGYAHWSIFIRSFGKKFDISPGDFRRLVNRPAPAPRFSCSNDNY